MNIQKEFVTFDIALKLTRLGFDEECIGVFNLQKELLIVSPTNQKSYEYLSTPLWQQVIDWLRESYNIDIIIKPQTGDLGEKNYVADIWIFKTSYHHKLQREKSHFVAREKVILQAIELCEQLD